MFEQLDDDFFNHFYQLREVKCNRQGQHRVEDLAVIPWSIRHIENTADIVFFSHQEESELFDMVVIGYEGRECFMLMSQRGTCLKSETTIQCSSLIDDMTRKGIVQFVLAELDINPASMSWVNPGLLSLFNNDRTIITQ